MHPGHWLVWTGIFSCDLESHQRWTCAIIRNDMNIYLSHSQTHRRTQEHTQTKTQKQKHTYTYTYIYTHTQTQTFRHTQRQRKTDRHTQTFPHTHTQTETHVQSLSTDLNVQRQTDRWTHTRTHTSLSSLFRILHTPAYLSSVGVLCPRFISTCRRLLMAAGCATRPTSPNSC